MTRTRSARRRAVAAALAAVGLVGLGVASAAQLNVSTGSLGAGTAVVASCQPPAQQIGVAFATNFSGGQYRASSITLSNINAACSGKAFQIQLVGAGGAKVGTELTGAAALTQGSMTTSLTSLTPASAIVSVAILFHS